MFWRKDEEEISFDSVVSDENNSEESLELDEPKGKGFFGSICGFFFKCFIIVAVISFIHFEEEGQLERFLKTLEKDFSIQLTSEKKVVEEMPPLSKQDLANLKEEFRLKAEGGQEKSYHNLVKWIPLNCKKWQKSNFNYQQTLMFQEGLDRYLAENRDLTTTFSCVDNDVYYIHSSNFVLIGGHSNEIQREVLKTEDKTLYLESNRFTKDLKLLKQNLPPSLANKKQPWYSEIPTVEGINSLLKELNQMN